MNYQQFKKILDANPYSDDPQFIQAREQDPLCQAAYQKAMAEEKLLQAALDIPVPQDQRSAIVMNQSFAPSRIQHKHIWAAAATMVMTIALGLLFFGPKPTSDLEDFINEALVMEPTVYMSEQEIPFEQLQPLFASLGAEANEQLGNIHFMKLCPTLDGDGARMVFMNDFGQPITVLYMPNSPVEQTVQMQMKGFKGKIIALDKGSAAIIAKPNQQTAQIEASLKQNLLAADTQSL